MNGCGLSSEERDRLQSHSGGTEGMDVKASLLAFLGLLLICVTILVASLIARVVEERKQTPPRALQPEAGTSHVLRQVGGEIAFSRIGKNDDDQLAFALAPASHLESGPASRPR